MTLTNTTHVNFRGDARAALEFYRDVFGGELTVVTYADMHAAPEGDDAAADRVMWGQVAADNGFRLMAFDILEPRPFDPGVSPFFESVRGQAVEEVAPVWDGLAAGGTVLVPFGPAPWGAPAYGMVTDRFGVTWVVDVEA